MIVFYPSRLRHTYADDRMPQDAVESTLVYTKGRDIHAVGVIVLQMLLGRDVMDRYPDPQSALLTGMSQH